MQRTIWEKNTEGGGIKTRHRGRENLPKSSLLAQIGDGRGKEREKKETSEV